MKDMSLRIQTVAVAILSSTLIVLLLWFGIETKQRVMGIEKQWVDYNNYASATNHALAKINTNFGYGGFIHHFKNYILHQTEALSVLSENDLKETYHAIEEYRGLARTEGEKEALEKLAHVVDIYSLKFDFTRQLVAQGHAPREIETHVQVNDQPALEAIEFLTQHALKDSQASVQRTDQALAETIGFVNLGALLIPVIAFIAGVVIVFLRRIVEANRLIDEAKAYAESLVQAAPEAWLIVDAKGRIRGTNSQAQSLFGYSQYEMLGMGIDELMPERMRAQHAALRDGFFAAPSVRPLGKAQDLVAATASGREFPIEISLSYTRRHGELLAIAALRDITERRKAEQRQRLTQQVFDITAEAILVTDSEERIVDMNAAFCAMTGYSREEVLGRSPDILSSGRHKEDFYQAFWQALNTTGHWQGEIWNRHKDGHAFPSLSSISAVKDDRGRVTHFVAVYSDITSIKENEERLEELAHFDQLTGLPNRMLFHDRLRSSRARARRQKSYMAVMYVDLDGFKAVNDTLGHEAGDQLLAQAAARLRDAIRDDDTAARLGGDEFALLFNGLGSTEHVAMLAQRVIDCLTIQVETQGEPLEVSASVGVALYSGDERTEEQLLELADQAMYEAKRLGKRRYCLHRSCFHHTAEPRKQLG